MKRVRITRAGRVALFALLASCSDDPAGPKPIVPAVPPATGPAGTTTVATVTINAPVNSFEIGDASQFSVVLKDAAGNVLSGQPVIWSSSNDRAATVSP